MNKDRAKSLVALLDNMEGVIRSEGLWPRLVDLLEASGYIVSQRELTVWLDDMRDELREQGAKQ